MIIIFVEFIDQLIYYPINCASLRHKGIALGKAFFFFYQLKRNAIFLISPKNVVVTGTH